MKHDVTSDRSGTPPSRFILRILFLTMLLAVVGCRSVPVVPEAHQVSEERTPGVIEVPDAGDARDVAEAAETVDDAAPLAARINGESLTYDALERQFDLYFTLSGDTETYKQEVSLGAFLQRYILEILLIQEARTADIQVTEEEVEEEIAMYLKQTGLSLEFLEDSLDQLGLDMADARRFFGNNRLIDDWSRIKFKDITVFDEEVRAYYDGNPDYFHVPESVTASQILICHEESPQCDSGFTKQAARALAERLRNIATPENFSELAAANSMDETAAKGGRLGTLFKGFSSSAFEEAAFSLAEGEISDVVETNSGYHIILVTEKREASDTPFKVVKDMIRENILTSRIQTALLAYATQLKTDAQIEIFDLENEEEVFSAGTPDSEEVSEASEISDSPFPTFREAGPDTCTDDDGKPIIFLFSAASCPHCEWVGEAFDAVAQEYLARGLIEAHHYDMESGDDLLTEAVETKVPKKYLSIGKEGDPEGYLPYFNFGCRYDRIGTGYEEQDDLAAEAEEMNRVIEALLP